MAKPTVAQKSAARKPAAKKAEVPEFLNGNEACAEGALAAGCRFFAASPLYPAHEIGERLARRMPEAGGVFLQMENAGGALAACLGASWAGGKAMTATSGPGIAQMLDDVGFAVATETPVVIADVQRAGPSEGQATRPAQGDVQQVRWGAGGDYEIIALAPWSVQEMHDLTIEAFNLSEQYRVPTFLLADEAVGHLREPFHPKKLPPIVERGKPRLGAGAKVLATGATHDEDGLRRDLDPQAQARLVARLSEKILADREKIARVEPLFMEGAETVLIAAGIAARAAAAVVKAARAEGQKVGLLRLVGLWPFPEEAVRRACHSAKTVVVAELNRGQIAREVERVLRRDVVKLSKTNGEPLLPAEVLEAVRKEVV